MKTILTHALTVFFVVTVPVWFIPFLILQGILSIYVTIYDALTYESSGPMTPPGALQRAMEEIRQEAEEPPPRWPSKPSLKTE